MSDPFHYPKQYKGPTPRAKYKRTDKIMPKTPSSDMVQLTLRRLNKSGDVEEKILFLAADDISSIVLEETDYEGRPMRCTRVGTRSGWSYDVKEMPLEVRDLRAKSL